MRTSSKNLFHAQMGLRVLLLASAAWLMPVGAYSQTLEEAVRLGITNPDVKEAQAGRRAVTQELRAARGGYYPQFDLRGATGSEWTNNPTTAARARDRDDSGHVWMWRNEGSAVAQQLLFDGFAVSSEVERQRARNDSAAARVSERSEFIGLDVAQAFLDVLRNQEILARSDENVRAHERILSDVRARVQAGRSSVADLRQVEARLSEARATFVESRRRVEDAQAAYLRTVGAPPGTLVRPRLAEAQVVRNSDEAVSGAQQSNPSTEIARVDVDVGLAQYEATQAPFWPRLDVQLSGTAGHNIDGVKGDSHDFTALLVARWNLYRGGIDTARRHEALERVAEARERAARLNRAAEEEARRSYNAMVASREQTAILRERVAANERVREAYRQQFSVGQRDLLDLLDSENELFNAQTGLINADYTAQFAGYRILAVAGRFLSTIGVPKPAEATGGLRTKKDSQR